MSVLYVGTDTLESDASANATLALYRIATGGELLRGRDVDARERHLVRRLGARRGRGR